MNKSTDQNRLTLETLEPRMMLSTVSITASGSTGEENIRVLVAGEVIVNDVVSTSGKTFNVDVVDSVGLADVRIEFTNDLYQPEQGIDRNLTIESFQFDGEQIDLFAADAFSSGTWRINDGVRAGFGRGNTLHSNGYIQVQRTGQNPTQIDFNGETWNVSREFSDSQINISTRYNELVISGVDRAISIYRQTEFDPGQLTELTVNGWRNIISGEFSQQNSQAGAGVDFYNAAGDRIRQFSFSLNDNATNPSDRIQSQRFIAPEDATSAFLWVWVDGFESPNNIPLRLTDLNLSTVVEVDTEPPVATLQNGIINARGDVAYFSVAVTDNLQFESAFSVAQNIQIRVVDPNGFSQVTPFASLAQDSPSELDFSFVIRRQGGGNFQPDDAGTWQVFLEPNSLFDAAGNSTPSSFLGSFELIVN